MTDWTSGYVADIDYTYGYYTELNPLRLRLAFLDSGLVFPETATACELGFGQGMSVNIHAAASSTQWFGTDFNPSQAGFACELADASTSGAKLFDEAFSEFCVRDDLPDFDFIGLHGIWSWISDENRKIIVDFVRRKLKLGGVFYISYNTQPGWAAMIPVRHLITSHAGVMGAEGQGLVTRIDASLDFAERLFELDPLYSRVNPSVKDRIKKIKEQNRNYLAHEYFNRDWHPMHFADMAEWLAPAKLDYACSTNYLDHVEALNLTPDQQTFVKAVPDPVFRETVRDFMVNQQFRRDYWVRGARKITPLEQVEALREQRVIFTAQPENYELKVNCTLGEMNLNENVYRPIIDFMADHRIRTVSQIEQAVKGNDISFAQVVQALIILSGKGDVAPVQDDKAISKIRPVAERFNSFIMKKARSSADIGYLASPVTGGGIAVNRIQQLFIMARSQGRKNPEEWSHFAWQILSSQGHLLVKEGKTLTGPDENLAELRSQALNFAEKRLPAFRALGLV